MIELKSIYKSFEDKDVLIDINARFENGKTNLIIGQSGSGKTVLMKSIVGLLTPEKGEILYDGRNFLSMGKKEKKQLRREMGMIFQSAALFDSLSVLENVMFPLDMFSSAPLRDRFGVIERLELYNTEQLTDIVRRSAMILGIPCETDGAEEIAGRARGTPRIANRLLKRVRDFADVMGNGSITKEIASIALSRLEIDGLGLDSLDRRMLTMIIKGYNGGPVGLETLAAAIGEESVTLEDICEPFLMQLGFLGRTPRARVATRLAYEHLGIAPPEQSSPKDEGQLSF